MTSGIWACGGQLIYGKGFTHDVFFIGTGVFFVHINEAAWSNMDAGLLEGGDHRRSVLDAASSSKPRTDAATYIPNQSGDGPYRQLSSKLETRYGAGPAHLLGLGCC